MYLSNMVTKFVTQITDIQMKTKFSASLVTLIKNLHAG